MKFQKRILQELADDTNVIDFEIVETVFQHHGRWSLSFRQVFKAPDDKYYETFFRYGATENQDENPYEYCDDEIECDEVFPISKTITVYEREIK